MKKNKKRLIKIDPEHFEKILDKGFSYIEIESGNFIKATINDIRFSAEDIEKMINYQKMKNEINNC